MRWTDVFITLLAGQMSYADCTAPVAPSPSNRLSVGLQTVEFLTLTSPVCLLRRRSGLIFAFVPVVLTPHYVQTPWSPCPLRSANQPTQITANYFFPDSHHCQGQSVCTQCAEQHAPNRLRCFQAAEATLVHGKEKDPHPGSRLNSFNSCLKRVFISLVPVSDRNTVNQHPEEQ